MNVKQQALAAEVRAEMGRQNLKAAPIQRALGISSTAWGTWFVQCTRDVPISQVMAVAEYLGLTTSELLRRAEAASLTGYDAGTAMLESQLSPERRRAIDAERARRKAEGDAADPPRPVTESRSA